VVVLILLGLAANITLTLWIAAPLGELPSCLKPPRTLPCAALPTSFILQEPRCADKLLQAVNVTNVRVVAAWSEQESSTTLQRRRLRG